MSSSPRAQGPEELLHLLISLQWLRAVSRAITIGHVLLALLLAYTHLAERYRTFLASTTENHMVGKGPHNSVTPLGNCEQSSDEIEAMLTDDFGWTLYGVLGARGRNS